VTFVVGFTPDPSGQSALDLAAVLARSSGSTLHVVAVVPAPWPVPGPGRVDGEFAAWSAERGEHAVAAAQEHLAGNAPDVAARCSWVSARSASSGLEQAAREHDAGMVVLGSSREGALGRVVTGATAGRLLHSSAVPVALAPRGYRAGPDERVRRVTCAFRADADAVDLLTRTAAITRDVGAVLRVATFGVRGRTMYPPELAPSTEDDVLQAWTEQAAEAQRRALSVLGDGAVPPSQVETLLGVGRTWSRALDDVPWEHDDILVVGSSSGGALARVFLGSTATKIVRHSPVPVVVVPSRG
jgi:nucleotide-binding universal stress UspA family protein